MLKKNTLLMTVLKLSHYIVDTGLLEAGQNLKTFPVNGNLIRPAACQNIRILENRKLILVSEIQTCTLTPLAYFITLASL